MIPGILGIVAGITKNHCAVSNCEVNFFIISFVENILNELLLANMSKIVL